VKKVIVVCEIVIGLVFLAELVMVGGIVRNPAQEGFFSIGTAAADPVVPEDTATPVRDVTEDTLSEERRFVASLLKRQDELEKRERALQSEEKRLQALKKEILAKIDSLGEIEGRLTALLEMAKEINSQKYKDLAKIYEAAPPAQAGFMLEKLDRKTAAAIIMNMKSKKAGDILGHMNPAKSVEVTREITKSR